MTSQDYDKATNAASKIETEIKRYVKWFVLDKNNTETLCMSLSVSQSLV